MQRTGTSLTDRERAAGRESERGNALLDLDPGRVRDRASTTDLSPLTRPLRG